MLILFGRERTHENISCRFISMNESARFFYVNIPLV